MLPLFFILDVNYQIPFYLIPIERADLKSTIGTGTTMPEKDTNQKAPASKTEKAPTPTKNKSTTRYQIVKNGWGSRTNFQLSYGLRS